MPIVWCTILIAFIWVLSAILIGLRQMKWLLIGMAVDFGICVALVYPIIGSMSQNGVSVVQIIAYAIYVIFMAIVCELTVRRARKGHREEM
jgi:Na+-driven multidrug efflux pump